MTRVVRPYVGGRFVAGESAEELRSPWDGRIVGRVELAGPRQAEAALEAAWAARPAAQALSTARRRAALEAVAAKIAENAERFARAISEECGKPIAVARKEVERAVATFSFAAAEVVRFGGETLPIDLDPASEGYEAITRRVPRGVVVAISPFNFPLNLGAHKVAPALAVGAPVIWKPPPQAPGAAHLLAGIVDGLSLPAGVFQVLPCANEVAERVATDERVGVLSFTGSERVGWALKQKATRAKVVLELGGNAAAIVCADADLDRAAHRCAFGGMVYAGQVCISVQRIVVEEPVYDAFREKLLAEVAKLAVGDPSLETTVIGPMIDVRHAERVESWIEEARARGAIVHGGKRVGAVLHPAVLEEVPPDARVACEEVFGPVVLLSRFSIFDEALEKVNDSRFGLQAGLFSDSLSRVRRAWELLEVGGLVVGDYPTYRQDNMPYGGVKASGLGREGLRYAMEDYTETRLLVLGKP